MSTSRRQIIAVAPGAQSRTPETGAYFSVHDFIAVELPFDAVVAAFVNLIKPDVLAMLVRGAWFAEVGEVDRLQPIEIGEAPPIAAEPSVDVVLGNIRSRREAVVMSLKWRTIAGRRIPPIDADLEVVQFGPCRSHVHILGRSQLPPGVSPRTEQASMEQRLTIAVVRRLLSVLASHIADAATS